MRLSTKPPRPAHTVEPRNPPPRNSKPDSTRAPPEHSNSDSCCACSLWPSSRASASPGATHRRNDGKNADSIRKLIAGYITAGRAPSPTAPHLPDHLQPAPRPNRSRRLASTDHHPNRRDRHRILLPRTKTRHTRVERHRHHRQRHRSAVNTNTRPLRQQIEPARKRGVGGWLRVPE